MKLPSKKNDTAWTVGSCGVRLSKRSPFFGLSPLGPNRTVFKRLLFLCPFVETVVIVCVESFWPTRTIFIVHWPSEGCWVFLAAWISLQEQFTTELEDREDPTAS